MAFTIEAIILLVWLNRLLPSPVRVGSSLLRGIIAALAGGILAYAAALWLPFSGVVSSLMALPIGTAIAIPFILPEIRQLFQL
jgi:hypothetical protein